ncbi:hypothetical protein GQ43DRAFT_478589 [Delitschia confertaspora ATCC 74209]|uniref:Transmembrane protein 69 n=1 Tax=Delitschia confertaspora ATCC 74209 TaxID=1513339 RepID=A0A9P4JRQ0_9PLEO|nr:hypothetical protein GQ43DRAFT_478589 [Delitschia confertaspora ATCC 74209]
MLRTGASRIAFQAIAPSVVRRTGSAFLCRADPAQWAARFSSVAFTKRPQAPSASSKPIQAIFRRTLADKIDREAEKRYREEKLQPTPETVSATSTTRPLLSEVGASDPVNHDVDMMKGIKDDMETIKDTFSLADVPRPAYYVGLAGVLPYLGTSLSTVFCAWNINQAAEVGHSLLSPQTAELFLHVLEPLQLGYGAVILSFLGAIHWGLEFGGFGGHQGYKRYSIGVIAPAVAWPTLLLPIETALISQFCAFVLLYYVDTRAAYRGWTPSWYAIYRFVLTFIVGASIVVSLIGRGEVANRVVRQPGAADKITALREAAQDTLAKDEEEVLTLKGDQVEDRVATVQNSDDEIQEGGQANSDSK